LLHSAAYYSKNILDFPSPNGYYLAKFLPSAYLFGFLMAGAVL
jgi:hypothetical protein